MIRRYNDGDIMQLVELLRLNTPKFFDPNEEKDFVNYLEKHSENYFVIEDNSAIIGGGGFNYGFENGKTARISWDIMHPDMQRKGIGRKLTDFRIEQIKKNTSINKIVVRTTQLTYQFYEKIGFHLEGIKKDYWAKGFDLYQMKIELNKT